MGMMPGRSHAPHRGLIVAILVVTSCGSEAIQPPAAAPAGAHAAGVGSASLRSGVDRAGQLALIRPVTDGVASLSAAEGSGQSP